MTVSNKSHQGKEQEDGRSEGKREASSYLRLIQGLCLDNKMNL
jgi:hypothetical protein